MPRWHSGMGRHVCGAWKKTCLVRAALQRSLRCASIPTCSPRSWLIRSRSAYVMYSRVNSVNAHRAALGIEPRTSRTLSENHTTRPSSQLTGVNVCVRSEAMLRAHFGVRTKAMSDAVCHRTHVSPCACTLKYIEKDNVTNRICQSRGSMFFVKQTHTHTHAGVRWVLRVRDDVFHSSILWHSRNRFFHPSVTLRSSVFLRQVRVVAEGG
jgi:hypothetical protein